MLATLSALIRNTRQHHAIEHAALHLLSTRVSGRRMAGVSDPFGFTIVGAPDAEIVRRAVSDAMLRLQAGDRHLAIHPNCGTNLATTALLVTVAALVGASGQRSLLDRFLRALLLVLPVLVLSHPLGMRLQHYTTLADITDRWLVDVRSVQIGSLSICRVIMQ
jgi:hypothetical protein